ncbi:putative porin [uncultured Shewanella sp.]|uniref:putative porin n=1 Tax=uncultured Shewanella sp. TaxID=173975 RepID=UPI0026319BE4|nr:putative porin [uncultured Shewanella sp.]
MNNITLASLILLSLASHSTIAAEDKPFHHESQVDYITSSEEFSDGKWGLQYRYYQTAVNQETVPYALSGYLAQTSNIGGEYIGFGDSDRQYNLDGTYVFDSKWFVGLGYQKTDLSDSNNLKLIESYKAITPDSKTYQVTGGYYLNKTSAAYFSYQYNDGNKDNSLYSEDTTGHYVGAGLKTLVPMTVTEGIFIDASYHYADTETKYSGTGIGGKTEQNSNNFNLQADWYFTRSWSVGGYYHTDDSSSDNDDYGIGTAYFLRLNNVLSARINIIKQFEPDLDGVYGNLSVNARF